LQWNPFGLAALAEKDRQALLDFSKEGR